MAAIIKTCCKLPELGVMRHTVVSPACYRQDTRQFASCHCAGAHNIRVLTHGT
jgi:hypothetical protein